MIIPIRYIEYKEIHKLKYSYSKSFFIMLDIFIIKLMENYFKYLSLMVMISLL